MSPSLNSYTGLCPLFYTMIKPISDSLSARKQNICRCNARDVLSCFSDTSESISKNVLWYIMKGNSKMVVPNDLLFVYCNTNSYITLEFSWGVSNTLEFMDSLKKPVK